MTRNIPELLLEIGKSTAHCCVGVQVRVGRRVNGTSGEVFDYFISFVTSPDITTSKLDVCFRKGNEHALHTIDLPLNWWT